MFIPFKDLAPTARVWIYQCNRFLSFEETESIKNLAYEFVNDWTAHKQNLLASFEILDNLFLVIGVDENVVDASGCSIDKSVHFIKQVERFFDVDLFNRFNLAFKSNHEIKIMNVHELAAQFKANLNANEVLVFNNLVSTKNELENEWLVPVEKTWVNNFLN